MKTSALYSTGVHYPKVTANKISNTITTLQDRFSKMLQTAASSSANKTSNSSKPSILKDFQDSGVRLSASSNTSPIPVQHSISSIPGKQAIKADKPSSSKVTSPSTNVISSATSSVDVTKTSVQQFATKEEWKIYAYLPSPGSMMQYMQESPGMADEMKGWSHQQWSDYAYNLAMEKNGQSAQTVYGKVKV